MRRFCRTLMILMLLLSGCATVRELAVAVIPNPRPDADEAAHVVASADGDVTGVNNVAGEESTERTNGQECSLYTPAEFRDQASLELTAFQEPVESALPQDAALATPGQSAPGQPGRESVAPPNAADVQPHAVQFGEVIDSVYRSYPLLESALYSRNVALGQQIGTAGAFDLKLKGASENGPQGYYQTYRQNIGVVQPTYWGGELFAGYRIGRGDFQPWYQERQTNDGGEFKAGVMLPLARNRNIDTRRADLWKAGYDRSLAEPDIQAQLISYVLEASYAYWDWVAAGENHRIATRILTLATERTSRIESQVQAGFLDPPELTDNLRLVAIRQAKVADTRRKLQQTAAKLSVYWRDADGNPIVATEDQLPGFPEPEPVDDGRLQADIAEALSRRPELKMLDILRQQVQVDYSEAVNQLQPEINAVLWGSQDMGAPTSSKRDKSPYESEASVFLDVPAQRRKARGKMTETQGKMAQLSAKRRITEDKISVDVQMAHAALKSAWEQVSLTQEALERAEDLAVRERKNEEVGAADMLKVSLREQYAVESAEKHVEALKLYFESRADARAAMALDQIDR